MVSFHKKYERSTFPTYYHFLCLEATFWDKNYHFNESENFFQQTFLGFFDHFLGFIIALICRYNKAFGYFNRFMNKKKLSTMWE